MHLEPEITRCRILIGICAASFGLGDHPSYASEPFSILIAGKHSVIKLQNATDTRLILPSWRERPVASFSLACVCLIMIGICFWSSSTFLRYHGARGNQTHWSLFSDEICVNAESSWAVWQTERIWFFVRRREFKIHNLNGWCKMGRKHGYSGPTLDLVPSSLGDLPHLSNNQ